MVFAHVYRSRAHAHEVSGVGARRIKYSAAEDSWLDWTRIETVMALQQWQYLLIPLASLE